MQRVLFNDYPTDDQAIPSEPESSESYTPESTKNPTSALIESSIATIVELPPDRNPAAVYLARLAPSSRRVMRSALDTIAGILTGDRRDAETCPWETIRYQHTAAVRARLADRYAPSTANQHLSAFRGVLREAWRLGLLEAEIYQRASDIEPVKGTTLPAGRQISAGELRALFDVCADEPGAIGSRDAALLAILYGGGLRRSEAVSLDLADYNTETGALSIRHGKGNKARISYVTNGAADAIAVWINIRGTEPGPLLLPVLKSGKLMLRRPTAQTVFDVLRRRGVEAGLADFSPHDMRRSFVSELLDRGADISTVQKLAGHASVTTTARYDRRGESTKRKAVELIHVPFVAAKPK